MLLCLVLLYSCGAERGQDTERGMYYWQTVFSIDSTKSEFMNAHSVKKLYVRFFDVVRNADGENMPNATIKFDSIVNCKAKIIPVVFIHNDCMRQNDSQLGDRLKQRILQMCKTHHIEGVDEIQIDCDWSQSTRERFFAFMKDFQEKLHKEGIKLSATIRLHQLSQPVPPADKGVLMVYNTGDLTKIEIEKPILDINAVKPYLKYLDSYNLPMACAFPIYKWELLFRNGKFVDVIHSRDELPIIPGDSIVTREPSIDEILSTKKAIENIKPECLNEIILFDLNTYNTNRYKADDYEKIFN